MLGDWLHWVSWTGCDKFLKFLFPGSPLLCSLTQRPISCIFLEWAYNVWYLYGSMHLLAKQHFCLHKCFFRYLCWCGELGACSGGVMHCRHWLSCGLTNCVYIRLWLGSSYRFAVVVFCFVRHGRFVGPTGILRLLWLLIWGFSPENLASGRMAIANCICQVLSSFY